MEKKLENRSSVLDNEGQRVSVHAFGDILTKVH